MQVRVHEGVKKTGESIANVTGRTCTPVRLRRPPIWVATRFAAGLERFLP